MKINRQVGEAVAFLFLRQFDIEAHRRSPALRRAFVGGGHDARPTTGDDRKIMFRELFAEAHGRPVIRVARGGARRTEDGHRRTEVRERFKRFDELAHDAQDAPWVFLGERRAMIVHGRKLAVRQSGNKPDGCDGKRSAEHRLGAVG